ncbi:aspartyl/glutamyl-tRNA(Asn/Gln) amidotransferase subunit B [Ascosphaera apis ARSEF 7405]|uniref:Aspartyl/glutamyl-tRNA(Asn/Gln) amidotransferase subunit B n=1 Tax=Ascosphaera apis ARSEF 7405 TaxID=392613 RepID=A0A166P5T6_9EURO|nr:aspartyl/glutamyl-tRNA(Asn/Gln) amidotransferase subunit B [Ascosphaera apis ARSEF 7405]
MRSSLSASLHVGNALRRPAIAATAGRHTATTCRSQLSSSHLRAKCPPLTPLRSFSTNPRHLATHTDTTPPPIETPDIVPLRKQLKSEAKAKKAAKRNNGSTKKGEVQTGWELTVGIEVHAQLNTDTKLFSGASTNIDDIPNSNVALFDLAMPGSQPVS